MPRLTYDRLSYILELHDPEPYSGRGMYGRQCLSVQTSTDQSLMALLADLVEGCDDPSEAAELVRSARTDDMGRGAVVYWPRVQIPADAQN